MVQFNSKYNYFLPPFLLLRLLIKGWSYLTSFILASLIAVVVTSYYAKRKKLRGHPLSFFI